MCGVFLDLCIDRAKPADQGGDKKENAVSHGAGYIRTREYTRVLFNLVDWLAPAGEIYSSSR